MHTTKIMLATLLTIVSTVSAIAQTCEQTVKNITGGTSVGYNVRFVKAADQPPPIPYNSVDTPVRVGSYTWDRHNYGSSSSNRRGSYTVWENRPSCTPSKVQLDNLIAQPKRYDANGPYGNNANGPTDWSNTSGNGWWFGTNAATASSTDPKGCLWFPFAGYSGNPSYASGGYGSREENPNNPNTAWDLYLGTSYVKVGTYYGSYGLSLRCVRD